MYPALTDRTAILEAAVAVGRSQDQQASGATRYLAARAVAA
jgi:hypothetical protein